MTLDPLTRQLLWDRLLALVEEQAHCYWGTLAIGGPVLLDKEQMGDVLSAFMTYGQQEKRRDLASGNKFNQED